MIEPFISAVRDRPIGKQGGKATFTGIQQRPMPLNIQVGFLLPGETGIWQIFGSGTTPDGHIQ